MVKHKTPTAEVDLARAETSGHYAATGPHMNTFWEGFEQLAQQPDMNQKIEKPVTKSTARYQKGIESYLRSFLQQCLDRNVFGGQNELESYLCLHGDPLPAKFWKLYTRSICLRQRPNKAPVSKAQGMVQESEEARMLYLNYTTVRRKLDHTCGVYRRITSKPIAEDIVKECQHYLDGTMREKLSVSSYRSRQIATHANVRRLIEQGVFSEQATFKTARERLQLVTLINVMAFTAARPGELVLNSDWAYQNDGLKWGDVRFFVWATLGGLSIRLSVDITIRCLKGLRNSPEAYRTQPMYEDLNLPRALDAVACLSVLAELDGVFEEVDTLAQIYAIDPSTLSNGSEAAESQCLELTIKQAKRHQLVFRRFDFAGSSFMTNETTGWLLDSPIALVQKVSVIAGIPEFHLYCLRKLACNAINVPEVTEADAQLSVGHRRGTTSFANHYISRRTTIDFQGLVSYGKQSTEKIAARGLDVIVQKSKLSEEEQSRCLEATPEYKELELACQQLRSILRLRHGSQAIAKKQGDPDWSALEVKAVRLSFIRRAVFAKACLEKSERLQTQELRTRFEAINRGLEEDEEVDAEQDLLGVMAAGAEHAAEKDDFRQASEEADEHLAEGDNDSEEGCDASSATLETDLETPFMREQRQPTGAANAVARMIDNLTERFQGKHQTRANFSSLFTANRAEEQISVPEASRLFNDLSGTRSALWLEICPGCMEATPGRGAAHKWRHVEPCLKQKIRNEVTLQVAQTHSGNKCSWHHCTHTVAVVTQEDAAAWTFHLRNVHMNVGDPSGIVRCWAKDDEGHFCKAIFGDGVIQTQASDLVLSDFLVHLQIYHGLMATTEDCICHCSDCDEWLIGHFAVETHYRQEHLGKRTYDTLRHCPICYYDESLRPSKRAKSWALKALQQHINTHIVQSRQARWQCVLCVNSGSECAAGRLESNERSSSIVCSTAALHASLTESVAALDFPDHLIRHGIPLAGYESSTE